MKYILKIFLIVLLVVAIIGGGVLVLPGAASGFDDERLCPLGRLFL